MFVRPVVSENLRCLLMHAHTKHCLIVLVIYHSALTGSISVIYVCFQNNSEQYLQMVVFCQNGKRFHKKETEKYV